MLSPRVDMSEREVFTSNLMREDIARIMYSFKPLLVGDGNKEEDVDQWIAVRRLTVGGNSMNSH